MKVFWVFFFFNSSGVLSVIPLSDPVCNSFCVGVLYCFVCVFEFGFNGLTEVFLFSVQGS